MNKKDLLIVIILLVGGSFAIIATTSLRNKLNKANEKITLLEEQKSKENTKETLLFNCLQEAGKTYEERWDSTCVDLGKELNENGSCLLPTISASSLDAGLKNAQDLCVTLYK